MRREAALRDRGFEVLSAETESQARFEIEMGRCGVLLICFRAREDIIQDLIDLFRRSCPHGTIIFVMNRARGVVPWPVDHIVYESAGPQAIVQALRSTPSASKAS